MEQRKRILTREELHELVWSTPILKLSQEYGLSDRGLAKICARHLVPTPPRGYWARLEAGLPVKKTPLRSVENKDLHRVHIGPANRPSELVAAALVAAKTERKRIAQERKQKSTAADAAPVLELPNADQPIDVFHRSVAAIVKQLRKAKPDTDGVISAQGVRVHERTRERAMRILHYLALNSEAVGGKLEADEHRLRFVTSDGFVHVSLVEERKRPKHSPTESELAEYERRKAKRDKERKRGVWSFGRLEPWPEFDIVYTGKLTLGYDGYVVGLRKSWSDGKSQTIESSLDHFVAGMRAIIVANAEEARKRAEQELRRQEHLRRREQSRLRAEREGKRLAYLQEVASARREAADMRLTIEAMPTLENPPPDYARMVAWAKRRLTELEARTTVETIQTTLKARELFPDPDTLLSPDGEPPPASDYRSE